MSFQMTGISIPEGMLGVTDFIQLYSYGGTTTVECTCGTSSKTIVTKAAATTTSVQFILPMSWAEYNTTGESVVVTFKVTTYDGDTAIGSYTVDKPFKVPTSANPFCTIEVSEVTDFSSSFGNYLIGASEIKIDVIPELAYGSEIVDCTIEAGGWTMHGGSATWKFFNTSVTITATVTDARGRSYTAQETITLLDYDYPSISLLTATRCDADGTENNQGSYIKVTYSGAVTAVNNKNTVAYGLKYKKTTDTSYTTVALSQTAYEVDNATYIFTADTATGYDVVLTLTDAVDSVERTTIAPSGFVLIDFKADGTAIGIGKAAETSNLFDVALAASFNNGITGKGPVKLGQGWTEGEIYSVYLSLTETYKAILSATGGLSINSPQFQLTSDTANFTVPLYMNLQKILVCGADATYPDCYYHIVDGEKEWLNPPMVAGTEYRTTKRHNGKPVYTKAVSVTQEENYSSVYVAIADDVTGIVSWNATMNHPMMGYQSLPYLGQGMNVYCNATFGTVLVHADEPLGSNITINATMEYTK